MRGRSFHIICMGCHGSSDLSDTECFMSTASRLPPGFAGEIVLKGPVDRSYTGPLVEAIVAASEVLDRLDGLLEMAHSKDRSLLTKGRRQKTVLEARSMFIEDPSLFLKESGHFKKRLTGKGAGEDGPLKNAWDDVFQRTELMLRKLDLSTES